MSHTEVHTGKIAVVAEGVRDSLNYLKSMVGLTVNESILTNVDDFYELQYKELSEGIYKYKHDRLFLIMDQEFEDEGYFSQSKLDEIKQEISYNCMFYNGGTDINEHIDEYIDEHFGNK